MFSFLRRFFTNSFTKEKQNMNILLAFLATSETSIKNVVKCYVFLVSVCVFKHISLNLNGDKIQMIKQFKGFFTMH